MKIPKLNFAKIPSCNINSKNRDNTSHVSITKPICRKKSSPKRPNFSLLKFEHNNSEICSSKPTPKKTDFGEKSVKFIYLQPSQQKDKDMYTLPTSIDYYHNHTRESKIELSSKRISSLVEQMNSNLKVNNPQPKGQNTKPKFNNKLINNQLNYFSITDRDLYTNKQ